jgi:hypothetical protein
MLNKLELEHTDGIGDGLSIALAIVGSSADLREANTRITATLLIAREAKDRNNIAHLRELVGAAPSIPP